MRRIAFRRSTSSLLMGLVVSAGSASAQESEPMVEDEIIVTATKRAQTLQETPVAVSVVGAEEIERAQIRDLIDLQTSVPSLRVDQLQSSANTNFIIRGFGNGANNAGIEPSVGVFVDGVYRSRSAAQISDLPNVSRVEVLRGPQSTLFGKNASAGIISIVTEEPRYEFGGSVDLSYGNYNAVVAKGVVTGGLTDTLAASLSAGINRRDGYIDDIGTGADTNERDRWFVRGQVLWEPSDHVGLRIIADYDRIDELCCEAANIVNGPTGAVIGALGGQIVAEDPFAFMVANNFGSTNEIENYGVSAQLDYDFGDLTLTSITAYREVVTDTNQDSDFTSADLLGSNATQGEIETFTQEVRLATDSEGPLNGLLGVFYFDEDIAGSNQLTYGRDFRAYADFLSGGGIAEVEQAILGLPVGTFQQAGQGIFTDSELENEAWTVFAQADFEVSDALTLTGGISYTDDKKQSRLTIESTDAFSALDFVAIGSSVIQQTAVGQQLAGLGVNPLDPAAVGAFAAANPEAFARIQAGAAAFASANATNGAVNPLLALQPLQFLPPFLDVPNTVESGRTADDKFTYTLRAAYDVSSNVNVYASYATGFKASSVNLSIDSRPPPADFVPGSPVTNPPPSAIRDVGLALPNLTTGTRFAGREEARVIEAGLKTRWNRAALNLTVFDQEIDGFQSNIFNGTGFELRNAGVQSTFGVEFDGRVQLSDALSLRYALTYLDAEFDEFVESGLFDAAGNEIDLSGERPAGVPEFATVVGGTYVHPLGGGREVVLNADYSWEDEVLIARNVPDATREVELLNASATLSFSEGLAVSLWARNLLDSEYLISAFPAVAQAGSFSAYPSQPRTYGVQMRYGF